MSGILLWTGLTLMIAVKMFVKDYIVVQIGAVAMILGAVLMWLDYLKAQKK
jgi:hypothetical protein